MSRHTQKRVIKKKVKNENYFIKHKKIAKVPT